MRGRERRYLAEKQALKELFPPKKTHLKNNKYKLKRFKINVASPAYAERLMQRWANASRVALSTSNWVEGTDEWRVGDLSTHQLNFINNTLLPSERPIRREGYTERFLAAFRDRLNPPRINNGEVEIWDGENWNTLT